MMLVVLATHYAVVGDRLFPVVSAHTWNTELSAIRAPYVVTVFVEAEALTFTLKIIFR